jgi:probable rRNA maturation factor
VSTFCSEVLRAMGVEKRTLTVVFVGPRKMRNLNRQHLGRDSVTDVLSFSYEGEIVEGSPFLGEIVIALEVAWRQAHLWRTEPERELRQLLVHGILHLLGYDHESDTGEMKRLQQRLLRRRALSRAFPAAIMRVKT